MKFYLSTIFFGAICFSPLFAQTFLDDNYKTIDKFEVDKAHYILKTLNDSTSEILDLEENLIGIEENKIKKSNNNPYLVRELFFYDENKNVIEKHQLTHLTNNIRYSTYLNHEQQVIRQEQWKNDILSFRSIVDPVTGVTITDKIIYPGPIGGFDEWNKYLAQNLRYPREAIKNRLSGTVNVSFVIDNNGNLRNIETNNSDDVHSSLIKEAKRVINQFKGGWQSHEINGETFTTSITIPISFRVVFN